MAEFLDILKFAGDFTTEARDLKVNYDPEAFQTKWNDTLKDISTNNGGEISFDPTTKELKIGEIQFNEEFLGKIDILNGNAIDPVDGLFKPDTQGFYKSLGYPEESLNTDAAKEYFNKSNTSLQNRPSFKEFNDCKRLNTKLSEEQIKDKLNASKQDTIIKDLTDQVEKGKEGTFIKSTVRWIIGIVLTSAIIAGGLLAFLSAYRDAMNGCWLIDTNTGTRYKIKPLTCNQNCLKYINIGSSFSIAEYCTNINGPCQTSQFNPMADRISNGTGITLPPYQDLVPGTYYDSGPNVGTCDNFTPCLVPCTTIPSNGSNCSQYCNANYLHVVPGQKIICADFTIADAFTDITGKGLDALGAPLSILGKALQYVFYIVIGIVSLFLVYLLIRFIFYISKKVKVSPESKNIEIDPQAPPVVGKIAKLKK